MQTFEKNGTEYEREKPTSTVEVRNIFSKFEENHNEEDEKSKGIIVPGVLKQTCSC